jgi:hypothetical protein
MMGKTPGQLSHDLRKTGSMSSSDTFDKRNAERIDTPATWGRTGKEVEAKEKEGIGMTK